jgi:hypothetical protein
MEVQGCKISLSSQTFGSHPGENEKTMVLPEEAMKR